MNKDTQMISVMLDNQSVINRIHVFDEVRDYYVKGVEISLKKDDFIIDSKYTCVHKDPFMSSKGYIYLVIGTVERFNIWVKMKIEGKIADYVCRKFNFFNSLPRPTDKEIEDYRINITEKIKSEYPKEIWDIFES